MTRHWLPAVIAGALVVSSLVAAGLIIRAGDQDAAVRRCAFANQIVDALEVNRVVTQDTLTALRDHRLEAAAEARTDGHHTTAARETAAARQYDLLLQRLQPIRPIDCE